MTEETSAHVASIAGTLLAMSDNKMRGYIDTTFGMSQLRSVLASALTQTRDRLIEADLEHERQIDLLLSNETTGGQDFR